MTWDGTGSSITPATGHMRWSFSYLYSRMLDGISSPNSDEIAEAKRYVNDGYLEFLRAYDWAFLRVETTLTLSEANDGVESLPAVFGEMFDAPIITTSTVLSAILEHRPIDDVMHLLNATGATTGTPMVYAIREATFSSSTGGTKELVVYPAPSSDMAVRYAYKASPAAMTDDAEYPWGGPDHGPTILAAARKVKELDQGQIGGVMAQAYDRNLIASIRSDNQLRPKILPRVRGIPHWENPTFTYYERS
jgi:hypothetical protein